MAGSPPLVSVLVAARDAEATIAEAARSVLAQSVRDLELLVVDDGSADATASVVERLGDPRVRVVRNERSLGLAGALNVGLDEARGTYVARMDADDLALPGWLDRLLVRMRSLPRVAVVGTGMIDLHPGGRLGTLHRMPTGPLAVRWAALFSSPFLHSTVLLDRSVLERHDLRYDTSFGESEDFDLWARLLSVAEGDNVQRALVLYRKHPAQASTRRAELQRECQRRIALRQIGELAPELDHARADLAWRLGAGAPVADADAAAEALVALVRAFEVRHGGRNARHAAAWTLARAGRPHAALRLDPLLPLRLARRGRRRRDARGEREATAGWLARSGETAPVRVTLVFPELTPYRTPMLDLVAARPELDATVLYASTSVQRRTWSSEPRHRAVVLGGIRLPGLYRALRHDYPLSLGVFRALRTARPEVVVASGWSTFASQAAAWWCRRHRVPFVLLVESNDRDPRPGWRRIVKALVVPRVLRGTAAVLVVGSLARDAMVARGVPPERISVFADAIDVATFAGARARLEPDRDALRADVGLGPDDVGVLCVSRLAPEKGLDTLVRAVAEAADERLVVLLAGAGPEGDRLRALAARLGVRLVLLPHVPWAEIALRYVLADVFALLSRHEPWAVVVNEAAASGLPLVLSDRVGAAHDLVREGENGFRVPADDHVAAGRAIRALAVDPELRRSAGARSLELVRDWDYDASIENLVAVVQRLARR